MYEIWKPVLSVPGVEASSLGRVRQTPFLGKTPTGGERGYGGQPRTGTWDGERYVITIKRKNYKVARLVCEAFHGPAPAEKPLCLHEDENSRNNRPGNLSWGTPKENMNAPGFLAVARQRPWLRNRAAGPKLTSADAARIRAAAGTRTQDALAREYGVAQSHISGILNGKAW